MRKPVVFMYAHPDDMEIYSGGTALLLRRRYALHVVCVTAGQRGIRGKGPDETAAIRRREAAAACRILGARLWFLGQMDGEVFAGRNECAEAAALLRRIKPVALFTHWPLSKPDHSAVSNLALRALELAGRFWHTEVYMAATRGAYHEPPPDVFVNTTEVIDAKKRLLRCHRSQISSDGVEGIVQGDASAGRRALCDFAEGYASALAPIAVRWRRKAGSILMQL